MEVLKAVLIGVAVVVSAFWVLGFWAVCSYNSKNAPKTDEKPQLDKLDDKELFALFKAVLCELSRRKMTDENPFEDLE